ncbi:DUF6922 domain-containing protein [Bacteroidota bacterium]
MNNQSLKIENLSAHLFWDVDRTKLDLNKNRRLIIQRVFLRGDIPDIKIILQLYDLDTIKEEILKAGFLDKKTLKWASDFLNIPKTKFLCYVKEQSKQVH